MLKRFLTALTISLVALSAEAQPYCDVRTFNILDGLAANNIGDIDQAPDKIMWFGTWNGLCYYDGYTFRTFRDKPDDIDVLMTNRIHSIDVNMDNDVWVKTVDGHIYVFNTKVNDFMDFSPIIEKKTGLKNTLASDIFTLKNGTTWIDLVNYPAFIRITHDPNATIDNEGGDCLIEEFSKRKNNADGKTIEKVELDKFGNEWVFTDNSLILGNGKFWSKVGYDCQQAFGNDVYLASKEGDFARYNKGKLTKLALPKEITSIYEMMAYDSHRMLLATNNGIAIYTPAGNKFEYIHLSNPNSPSDVVKKLFTDSKKRVWAFTEASGVSLVDVNARSARWMMADVPNIFEKTTCKKEFFMEDDHGIEWMVPRNGTFSYYDEEKGSLRPYILRSIGYVNNIVPEIRKYYISDQRILWVSSDHSLAQINFKYHDFYLSQVYPTAPARSVEQDLDGRYLTGYHDGTLISIDIKDKENSNLKYMTPQGTLTSSLVKFSKKGVYALFRDHQDRMWIGTKGDGLFMRDKNGKLSHYVNDPKNPYSLSNDNVYDINSDERGRIWVSTYGGGPNLIEENANGMRFINTRNLFKNYPKTKCSRVRRIASLSNGETAICTTEGLVSFSSHFNDPGKIKFYFNGHIPGDTLSLIADDILQTYETKNGQIYITSMGGSLERVASKSLLVNNLKMDYLHEFTPDEGTVESMVEDNSGNLWIVRESSLDCYNPKTRTISAFGPNDFDMNTDFTEARPIHDPVTDRITLCMDGGILSFIPSKLTKTDYEPKIIFTDIQYQGESEQLPILHAQEVHIPSDKRDLTISFSALDYSRNYQMKYAYKIEGVDDKWIQLGSRHFIAFNKIPKGHMRLLVKSTNTHGVWANNVTSLNIYAEPTFVESVWFKILLILLFCGLLYVLYYFDAIKQRIRMEREMTNMKTRFYSNVFHQLRTPLTLIGGPVHEVLEKEKLTESSRSLLEMVRRNAANMLNLVNKMLEYNRDKSVFIDDNNANAFLADVENEQGEKFSVENKHDKDFTILVVEDNVDLRAYLYSILRDDYNVIMAENGQIGLEKARAYIPDFILTDVTMPVMDGLEMIHEIRQDKNISHIPIIILSARASMEDMVRGNKEGVISYITKPFSATYLKGRIENIVSQRRIIQQEFLSRIHSNDDLDATAPVIIEKEPVTAEAEEQKSEVEEELDQTIQKAIEFLDENLANPDVKIDDIAKALAVSRSVLYGKIKTAVGMTPVDFVRHIRILRAEKLITDTKDNFSKIAYAVGFSDPKYFSKVFKKETGLTPSEYRDKKA